MYLVKTPGFIRTVFPNFVWNMPPGERKIFLTFDDGPIPEVTPWVLDQLKQYNAKATFFCVGENVTRHTDIFNRVVEDGHAVGSHTFNHLSGWQTENVSYFHNARHCATLIKSNLFRPPYGRIKPSQAQFLQRHYDIIMWDVLSGDFDKTITKEKCLDNVINYTHDGSVVVFHDSVKTYEKLQYVLPIVLAHFHNQGYKFEKITSDIIALRGVQGAKSA